MYQKYMKRGLSIMVIATLCIMIATMFDMALFAMPLAIVFAFSFFDTFNLRNMKDEERGNYKDDYIWNNDAVNSILPKMKNAKFIGVILIAVGIYFILLQLANYAYRFIDGQLINDLYWFVKRTVPALLVAGFCIYGGCKLVK